MSALAWLLVIVGFSFLIVIHEFGHFIVAKWTGMRVERFFLFFPPRLWSVRRGETEYGIGMIPLGGFVKITGMNPEELEDGDPEELERSPGLLERVESADQEPGEDVSTPGQPVPAELRARAYYNQPVWKRIVVIGAGPAMNILLAFLILFVLAFGVKEISGPGLEVGGIAENSPAAESQLEKGDEIVSIDGIAAKDQNGDDRADAFRDQIGTHTCGGEATEDCAATTPVQIVVERDGQRIPLSITPEYDPAAEQALLGVAFSPTDTAPSNPAPTEAADIALDTMWLVTSRTATVFGRIFEAEQREQISGVVGISDVAHQTIESSGRDSVFLLALISLSLGLINLLPLLPLDGGHIFWSLVEKVRGRRVPFRVIEQASAIGILVILFLFFIGLSNDVGRLGDDGNTVR